MTVPVGMMPAKTSEGRRQLKDVSSEAEERQKNETSSSCSTASAATAQTAQLLEARKLNLKLTPLEEQVVSLKEKHADLLLIIQCGYKYCIFGEDAETAAVLLKIGTYKNHHFLSCSFPIHRLSVHVKRLVVHGCKVGVVRQKVAPLGSKYSPFIRQLGDVYTKATLIDESDSAVAQSESVIPLCMVFICEAFGRSDGRMQIGAVGIFTQNGDLFYDHFEDDPRRNCLDGCLAHWQPAEIIFPSRSVTKETVDASRQFSQSKSCTGDFVRIERVDCPLPGYDEALEQLHSNYAGQSEVIEMLTTLPPVLIHCLILALTYMKQFKMERLLDNITYSLTPFLIY